MNLPPGPRLASPIQALLLVHDPVGYLERCRRRYGPVFRIRPVPGYDEVFVATPELAGQVYATDTGAGRAGAVRRDFLEPIVGANSLLCLDGEPWKRHRKLINPAFHGRMVASYHDVIAEITTREIESWPAGEPLALWPRMQQITLDVILRLVFGIRDADRLGRLRLLLPRLLDLGTSNVMFAIAPVLDTMLRRFPLLGRLPFLPTTRFLALRREVDDIVHEEIRRRRAHPYPDATDVLSRLIDARDEGPPFTDTELRDELLTLLMAGHETTATGLAWAFERLARHPEVIARLRAETEAGREEYLDAVIKESLRTRPVVYEAARRLTTATRIGDHTAPAGWYVSPMIALIHRDPETFSDPEAFRPERFLGTGGGDGRRGWMPFGGGRRYCVGAQLALLEMRVVIREVLHRFDLTPADPVPEKSRLRHVTLVPAHHGRVIVRPRNTTIRHPRTSQPA
jgi:cytochrome P450